MSTKGIVTDNREIVCRQTVHVEIWQVMDKCNVIISNIIAQELYAEFRNDTIFSLRLKSSSYHT